MLILYFWLPFKDTRFGKTAQNEGHIEGDSRIYLWSAPLKCLICTWDNRLRFKMPDVSLLIGYADGVAVLVVACTVEQTQHTLGMEVNSP